jgi:hypothetical protein
VIASYNFDGVTVEGKADCHITGLPYKEQVPKNTGTYKWSENEESTLGKHNIKWNNDGVKLEGSSLKQIIYSPSFNVPNNVNVKLAVPVELYSIGVGAKAIPELKCRISGVQSFTKKGLDPGRFGSKTETYSGTGTGSLTTSNPIIEIENAYTMASAYIYVKKVTIEYN